MIQSDLINNLPTPCFIFDESEFARGVNGFRNALESRFPRVAIGHSVKTNSLPYAMKIARQLGCMAEVVSLDEYRLARQCGFTDKEIIYNGPMKSRDSMLAVIRAGGIVNLETKRELEWLKDLPADAVFDIGIRLNINISHISPEDADGEDDNSRFGFSDESDEFRDAIASIGRMPNLRLAGLHIHRTTHSRAPRFYERSVAYAAAAIRKYGLHPDYLDVGGGYFGIFPDKPTFVDYSEAIYRPLAAAGLEGLRIIVEPGNALSASAFRFLAEVIDVKRVDATTRFVTIDGSRIDVDPFFHKSDYLKEIIYSGSGRGHEPLQIVAGCTCLEYDRLFTLKDTPRLMPGDRILFNNVGAYTLTLSPQFIRYWPRVYAVKDDTGGFLEVRRPSDQNDIFTTSNHISYE